MRIQLERPAGHPRRANIVWLALVACLLPAMVSAADKKPGADRDQSPRAADPAPAEPLHRMFEEGYIVGPKRLQEAQKIAAQARKSYPGDPRVDYAQGLVLLKQSQVKPAIAQFDAAVKRDGVPCWPAWQALVWALLSEKHYEQGLEKLVEFAGLVRKSEPPGEISEAQRAHARWVGQILEACARCADSRKLHDQLADVEVQMLDAFGDELSEELDAGREFLRAREFALDQAAGAARKTADKTQERHRQNKAARLDKDLEGIGKAKENAAKSAEEWKKWIDDTLAQSDKQLGRLEGDYKFLEQRAASLDQSITQVGRELTAMNLALTGVTAKNTDPLALQNAQYQVLQRQNQMLNYQFDYNATIGRMNDVARQGTLAIEARAEAIASYEAATGDLVKKGVGLDRWSARLKDQKKKLAVQKPGSKGGTKAVADNKPPSLKMILPLDLEGERDRLLATFAPPSGAPKDVQAAGGK